MEPDVENCEMSAAYTTEAEKKRSCGATVKIAHAAAPSPSHAIGGGEGKREAAWTEGLTPHHTTTWHSKRGGNGDGRRRGSRGISTSQQKRLQQGSEAAEGGSKVEEGGRKTRRVGPERINLRASREHGGVVPQRRQGDDNQCPAPVQLKREPSSRATELPKVQKRRLCTVQLCGERRSQKNLQAPHSLVITAEALDGRAHRSLRPHCVLAFASGSSLALLFSQFLLLRRALRESLTWWLKTNKNKKRKKRSVNSTEACDNARESMH